MIDYSQDPGMLAAPKPIGGSTVGRFENSKFLLKNYRHVESLVIHKNKHENTLNIANFQI